MNDRRTLELPAGEGALDWEQGSILFVGTATVIVRYAGFTILTDPNFLHKGDHVHLGYGLRSRRLTDPALLFHQLPAIDLVILSHFHEDHFDRVVQRRLAKNVPIVTAGAAHICSGTALGTLYSSYIAVSRIPVKGAERSADLSAPFTASNRTGWPAWLACAALFLALAIAAAMALLAAFF